MIYACLRFIEEWAHPLTLVNFVADRPVLGLPARRGRRARRRRGRAAARWCGPAALVVDAPRRRRAPAGAAPQRRACRHRSTLQSATGIAAPRLVQTSMGMSAGSFNTREFFHRASAAAGCGVPRALLVVLGFALPALLAALGLADVVGAWPWLAAAGLQVPGLIVDRWFFFAQAKHPQNLYYQVVS